MNPVLRELPTSFASERLCIRMPKRGDEVAVYDAIKYSRKSLQKWLPFAQKDQTIDDVKLSVRLAHIAFLKRDDLRLHIFLRETGAFIGSSGLHRIDWDIPKVEIGYWIDDRFSGKGYMTEAVDRITAYAAEEINARRVEIRCDVDNAKSRANPEALGFALEGILSQDSMSPSGKELRDTCIYAKTR